VTRIAIVAGEASGDLLGAALMRALLARWPDLEFEGIVGPKMAAEGAKVTAIDKAPIQARAKEGVAKMEKDGAWSSGLWDQIQKL